MIQKRLVEQRVHWECAATKWWFGAELLEHELFNRVIEKPPASTNAGLTGIARTPGDTESRPEPPLAAGECRIAHAFRAQRRVIACDDDAAVQDRVGSGVVLILIRMAAGQTRSPTRSARGI